MALTGTGGHASEQLGQGWKVSPSVRIDPHQIFTMAEIDGPAAIQHIWLTTHPEFWRCLVLRIYWDGEPPLLWKHLGDFFCMGWCERANVSSLAVCVNPRVVLTVIGRCLSENRRASPWKTWEETLPCITR